MVDVLGTTGDLFKGSGGGGVNVNTIMIVLAVLFVVGIIVTIATVLIVMRRRYKYQLVLFERVDGRFKVTKKDRARKIVLGSQGDEAFFIQKAKKIIPIPQIQTGDNIYWFFISDDGEWINFGPGDFDEDRREIKAQMLDKEMRAFRMALHHMADQRLEGSNFWEKYGGMIAYAALILVTAVGFWLIVKQMSDVVGATRSAVEAAESVVTATKDLLGGLNNVQQGGAGFIEAS